MDPTAITPRRTLHMEMTMQALNTFFKRVLSAFMGGSEAGRRQAAIAWTNELLTLAVRRNAPEIRIEPFPDRISVQFCLGQRFVNGPALDRRMLTEVAKCLKRMASLDEGNMFRRQSGFVNMMLAGKPIRFKVTAIPFSHAEYLSIHFDE